MGPAPSQPLHPLNSRVPFLNSAEYQESEIFIVPLDVYCIDIYYTCNNNFTNYKKIVFHDNITFNDPHFNGLRMTEEVNIPSKVKSLPPCCFECCWSLKIIHFHDQIKSFGGASFRRCFSLEEFVVPKTVNSLPDCCFEYCHRLKIIHFHDQIKEIGGACFFQCVSLEEITIPPKIKIIRRACFNYCSSLRKLIFHQSVSQIQDRCFQGCESLIEVICMARSIKVDLTSFSDCISLQNFSCYSTTNSNMLNIRDPIRKMFN